MIFISYRILDSLDLVCRLDADLTREFGHKHVFRDKSRMITGKDWDKQIEENAKCRRVMLVVIGPTWQTVTFQDGDLKGFPRLHDADDWVRREITLALDAGNIVLPLFLNGAAMPTKAWLKHFALDRLYTKQGLPLRSIDYDSDFATLVTKLREHCQELLPLTPQPSYVWQQMGGHPLPPAPHFEGREAVLKDLSGWAVATDDPNRVVALIAPGGNGKTAIAERMLASLGGHTGAGVFVWNFYENPKTEAFLRAACEYFLGKAPRETGGLLERLQKGLLADNLPHLVILDGLELVQATGTSGRPRWLATSLHSLAKWMNACGLNFIQATGTTGRPRGELKDPLLKQFLRWLVAGYGIRAKTLITSQFPLPDLADWKGRGFCPIDLADLDIPTARTVLRRWGVRGTDAALDALSESVHQHGLTVDVLGFYLGTFHGGDPTKAPLFDPQLLTDTNPKAAQLHRVLRRYAAILSLRERDLLARLSVVDHSVTVDNINALIAAGGELASTLEGCGQGEVLKLLERLRVLGLILRYDAGGVATFAAHPFVRAFFKSLLRVENLKQIREVIRKGTHSPDHPPMHSKDHPRSHESTKRPILHQASVDLGIESVVSAVVHASTIDPPLRLEAVVKNLPTDNPVLDQWLDAYIHGSNHHKAVGLSSACQDPITYLIDEVRECPLGTQAAIADAAHRLLKAEGIIVRPVDTRLHKDLISSLLQILGAYQPPPTNRPEVVETLDWLRTSDFEDRVPEPGKEPVHRLVLRALATQLAGTTDQAETWEARLINDLKDVRFAAAALGVLYTLSPPLAWVRLPHVVKVIGDKAGFVTVLSMASSAGNVADRWTRFAPIFRSSEFGQVLPLLRKASAILGIKSVIDQLLIPGATVSDRPTPERSEPQPVPSNPNQARGSPSSPDRPPARSNDEPRPPRSNEPTKRPSDRSSTTPRTFYLGTGRRKTAVAQVRVTEGTGWILFLDRRLQSSLVEDQEPQYRTLEEYFTEEKDRAAVLGPLKVTDQLGRVDVFVNVRGGGTLGQVSATSQGLARAIMTMFSPPNEQKRQEFNNTTVIRGYVEEKLAREQAKAAPNPPASAPDGSSPPPDEARGMVKKLRDSGYLTRDARMKERKKYGLRGARRGTQFSKR